MKSDRKNLYERDENGWTCLHHFAKNGDFLAIEDMIKQDANIGVKTYDGRTAFSIACEYGRLDVVDLFLINYAILYERDCSALVLAINNRHYNLIQVLIEAYKINGVRGVASSIGLTPLHVIAKNLDDKLREYDLKLIIEFCAINGLAKEDGNTALHYAAISGNLRVAKLLLHDRSVKTELVNKNNQTPLELAIMHGRAEISLLLYKVISNPDQLKWSVFWAAKYKQYDIARVLINFGAELLIDCDYIKDVYVNTDAQLSKDLAIIKLLEYIKIRSGEPKYITSFNLFCAQLDFGKSREQAVDAASALEKVAINGDGKEALVCHISSLEDGRLEEIYSLVKKLI